MHYQSILIIKRGALGDILAGTAAIVALKKQYPKSHLCLLSDSLAKKVCPEGTIVDEIIDEKEFTKSKLGYVKLLRLIRSRRFDLIINLKWTSEFAGLLTLLGKSKFTAGAGPWWLRKMFTFSPRLSSEEADCHEYLLNLRIVQSIGVPKETPRLYIHVGEEDTRFADDFFSHSKVSPNQVLIMTPVASTPLKAWPSEKFVAIAKRFISEFGAQVLISYAPSDKQQASEINTLIGTGSLLAPSTTVNQLAALLSKVKLCLCNNSGVMHVAYAVGTPVVCINTSIGWAPYGDWNSAVTQLPAISDHSSNRKLSLQETHQLLQSISEDRVWEALSSKWISLEIP